MKNKKISGNTGANVSDEFFKNEVQTNIIVSAFLIGFVIIGVVNTLLLRIDAAKEVLYANIYIFAPINFALVVIALIAHLFHFNKPWIKHMLLSAIILVSMVSVFMFPMYTIYLVLVPLFVSIRYFNQKIIATVAIITTVLFVLSIVLNVWLEHTSEVFRLLHQDQLYNSWTRLIDAAIYLLAPCIITLALLSVFAVNITKNGRKLISSKIASTQKIAAVNAELDMASQIQRSVLPNSDFTTPDGHFTLHAYESPAKEVCGDFYDYFMLREDVLAIIVADVSDKGLPAAMFMMSAKKALQCAVQSKSNLEDAIALANELICSDNKYGMFLTLWMGIIDTRSGIGKYINAGHPYPVINRGGEPTLIENEPDLFIGNFKDRNPRVHSFSVKEGDMLFIYTDGLTDATNKNGETFDVLGILPKAHQNLDDPAKLVSMIADEVQDFMKDSVPFDDITMLALKCRCLDAPKTISLSEEIGTAGTAKINGTILDELAKAGCPDEKRRNIGVAIDEVCSNISEYAYEDKTGKMECSASFYDNCLEITFADSGTPVNPLLKETVKTDPLQIGGLGIFFIRQLSDDIAYEYKDGKNQLTLRFIWKI